MIDIIMPCYNAEKYIQETIQSVLKQTEKNFKLICIDDCSKDETYSILQQISQKDKRITVLRNEKNCGIATTRNRGIRVGKSQYIAFLDDDDIMPLDRLKLGKKYLDEHDEVGVVAGNYLIFDETGNKTIVQENKFFSAKEVRSILPFVNIIPNGSTLIRRNIIEKNGICFHEKYGIEDYYFYTELSRVTDINVLPDILLEHRVMQTQYSAVCTNSSEKFAKRQDELDQIHKIAVNQITSGNESYDVFIRFVRENIGKISLKDIFKLNYDIKKLKKNVIQNNMTDVSTFERYTDKLIENVKKAYLYQKLHGYQE